MHQTVSHVTVIQCNMLENMIITEDEWHELTHCINLKFLLKENLAYFQKKNE